ncbi:hypothetical protein Sjap_012522 [Stephania japonica]|uniref:Probable purine permease n=1 Tax=Stephania japonica TaxID=461633 RepID=A0AAP0NZ01_9MAGN
MNIEGSGNGSVVFSDSTYGHQRSSLPLKLKLKLLIAKQWLLLVNGVVFATGVVSGPLLNRLYFLHGGNRKWISAWLQTSGFPILLIPISILYLSHQRRSSTTDKFFISPKFLLSAFVLGLLNGLDNFMYAIGLSFLPVSTSTLLFSAYLAFTSFFALFIARHRFTPYSINAILLMTLGSVLLGIGQDKDRPVGVTDAQYLLGFLLTLGAAALLGFLYPCIEAAFTKVANNITYSSVLQFQFCSTFTSTLFCTLGMIISKDFSAMPREAREFALGESEYYLVLAFTAVVWQMSAIGFGGLIFCSSSVTTGVFGATLMPMTEAAAVIVYHEKEEFVSDEEIDGVLFLYGDTQRVDPFFFEEDFENFDEEPKFDNDVYDFMEDKLVFGDDGLIIEVISLFGVPQVLEEVVRDVGVNNDSLGLIAKVKVLKFATNDEDGDHRRHVRNNYSSIEFEDEFSQPGENDANWNLS